MNVAPYFRQISNDLQMYTPGNDGIQLLSFILGLKRASQAAVTCSPGLVHIWPIVSDCTTSHLHSCRKLAKLDNTLRGTMKTSLRSLN